MTDVMTIALRWRTEKERRITSIANSMPAIGALNEAPMPAPAPAATRLLTWSWPNPVYRENDEPMAPPMSEIGPSRPPEPPAPSVAAVAMIFAGISLVGR